MPSFTKSNDLFPKVKKIIPLASQTFSKSHLQYIGGGSPMFLEKGKGSHVWDLDGNEYIDMVNGLLPIILGYSYDRVNDAIKEQLEKGITFSMPSKLEYELSQKLIDLIPCAEMVRFGKNGSDATSGAIRIARAVTKRDRVAVCGYHGWQDWYIAVNPRNAGIPDAVKNLTHKFEYNNIESLETLLKEYKGQFAAVIMEPMNVDGPEDDFLDKVKSVAHKHGALFILDEIITGFRYSVRGAQSLFNVTPDLATFGKSMANGMPISAVVGKEKYMSAMEDIFYSFTMGGECLSIAGAIATIDEIVEKNVVDNLWEKGKKVKNEVDKIIKENQLDSIIEIKGKPCWQIIKINDHEEYSAMKIKSLIQQEMIENGILWCGTHNWSYSHNEEDVDKLINVYGSAFRKLQVALETELLDKMLHFNPIEGNYNVRKL